MKENINENYKEFVHFCCTSEDINNLAYALMLKEFSKEIFLPKISNIVENLLEKT
jgi:adenylosuccinate lyase